MKIEKFSEIYSTDETYDRVNNPDRLNVFELSSLGISWSYNGRDYTITNERRLNAILLKSEIEIALVEAPFDENPKNKAYIVNSQGEIVWDIKELFLAKHRNSRDVTFYYPIYEALDLYFHIFINNCEFRFLVNIVTGEIGELLECR
ncbi:MAG: hypothetical protein LBU73_00205 [Helicobacteraceae bacterium]|nr:hypothetical protein [Helicobacteraceae bacterium]